MAQLRAPWSHCVLMVMRRPVALPEVPGMTHLFPVVRHPDMTRARCRPVSTVPDMTPPLPEPGTAYPDISGTGSDTYHLGIGRGRCRFHDNCRGGIGWLYINRLRLCYSYWLRMIIRTRRHDTTSHHGDCSNCRQTKRDFFHFRLHFTFRTMRFCKAFGCLQSMDNNGHNSQADDRVL